MIDIHNHIIWGIDDGSKSLEESLEMARYAESIGIKKIITTPHFKTNVFESDKYEILEKVAILNESLKEANIDIVVQGGQEIHLDENFYKYLESDRLLTIGNHQQYILVELPFRDYPYYIHDMLVTLVDKGLTPIIAHPERNARIRQHLDMLTQLVETGCLLQMNAASILGEYGSDVKKAAKYMIKNKHMHLIGSDAHNNVKRKFCIEKCYKKIKDEAFKAYLKNNSEKVWQEKEIDAYRYFKQ